MGDVIKWLDSLFNFSIVKIHYSIFELEMSCRSLSWRRRQLLVTARFSFSQILSVWEEEDTGGRESRETFEMQIFVCVCLLEIFGQDLCLPR